MKPVRNVFKLDRPGSKKTTACSLGVDEHIGEDNLDYFTHAILIIDSDNSIGPTEISHLENPF